ncbi:MAG: hypothetical protein K2J82_02415 [Muribaculaceae bacterium]|nr:hypothetical protein [Muribaculaceae bacterium]
MNKKLINGLLLLTVATSGAGMFTSCKDNDDANLADVYQSQNDLSKALQAKDADLAKRLKKLEDAGFLNQADREYLLSLIKDNNTSIDAVKAYLDGKIGSMVTSIEVQRVYNNMFGTLNLPFGINSTVLANYYYSAKDAVKFPNVNSPEANEWDGNKLNDAVQTVRAWEDGVTPEGVVDLAGNDTPEIGSLGKIYVQVNPVSVPAEGLPVTLVTSKGKVAVETTLELKAEGDETEEFKFGGGSRSAENGLYYIEVPATVGDIANIQVKLDENLKQIAKDYIDNKTRPDLANVAKGVYDQLVNTNLPAYAVKLGYVNNPMTLADAIVNYNKASVDAEGGLEYDADGNIVYNGEQLGSLTNYTSSETAEADLTYNYLFSKYDIAVATVHPLSFNSIPADFSITDRNLPSFGRIKDAIDEMFDKMKDKVNINIELGNDTWVIEFNKDNFKVNVDDIEINLTGMPVYGPNGDPIGTVGTDSDPVKIVLKQLPDGTVAGVGEGDLAPLIKAIQDPIDEVEKVVEQVNDIIDQLNEQLKKVNTDLNQQITDIINDIQNDIDKKLDSDNSLIKLYNKVVDKVNDLLKDPAHYMQVYAAYKDNGGDLHHFSTNVNDPSLYTGSEGFKIFLTSYNGEILVPAYKKIVAISNVYDLNGQEVANAKSILEKANSGADLNKVLDGERHVVAVEASNLEKGYIYEIYYSALDYRGKTSTNKYYIEVK